MSSDEPFAESPRPRRSFEHFAILVLAVASVVGLVVLGLLVEPDERGFGTHERLGLEPCWMMETLDLPCPGCGVTTSLSLASRGRLGASLRNQPLGFLLAALSLVAAVWAVRGALRGRDLWTDLSCLRFWTWAGPLGLAVAVAWAYKIARVRGWL